MVSSANRRVIVVGSGPNGLTAAVELAAAGLAVRVVEGAETPGGGTRTAELTLPGFRHDVCSAVHPLAAASPALRAMPLAAHGLRWITPPLALAHALDGGRAAVLQRDPAATAAALGADGAAYRRLLAPLAAAWDTLAPDLLGTLRRPRHPLALADFARHALRPARGLAEGRFATPEARALLAGLAAHAALPLERPGTAAFALILGALAHVDGWPFPAGGAQAIADALVSHLRALGGAVETGRWVEDVDALGPTDAVVLDLTPRQVLAVAGRRLPAGYRRALARYRYGPGAFKVDWALDAPVPWAAPACRRAATVHLGGTLDEIAAAEAEVWRGGTAERPFVILAQPSLFDPSRAPEGRHTAWAYCHVPHGSAADMTARIEAQVERFAPGFSARILARHAMGPAGLERHDPNLVGGDIGGGVQDLRQMFARPALRLDPHATPDPRLFLCSASTPPGGGVHGMGGLHAARSVLRRLRRR